MDLDRLDAPELADQLIGDIVKSTRDEELPLLMPFYKCYRAVIRGVVETLRSREVEVAERERDGALDKVEGFFRVCSAKPGGLTGTQGVIVPAANRAHLVLDDGVAEAVAAGRFHLDVTFDAKSQDNHSRIDQPGERQLV